MLQKAEALLVCVCLTAGYNNTPCRQLQRPVINVPDQQKADATLFIRVGGVQGGGRTTSTDILLLNYSLRAPQRAYFLRARRKVRKRRGRRATADG